MLRSISAKRARQATGTFLLVALAIGAILGALHQQKLFQLRGLEPLTAPPVNQSETNLGVNVSLEQYTTAPRLAQLEQIEALGIRHIKQSFFLSETFDWETADAIMAAVAQTDLDIVVVLDGDPAADFAPPADVADYADWAGRFASRYGDQIDVYFIWDEPNIASHWGGEPINPDLYGALLTAAAAAIRSADPGALIATAPLAPTTEASAANLAEPLFLQAIYETGAASAFDIVAARPFGFEYPPDERTVDLGRLNFSRVILLREVMTANGDHHKPIWAGNFGWNHLPASWTGPPSIWQAVTPEQQINFLHEAVSRSRTEWSWMGRLYWHHWDPAAQDDDPVQGFSMQHDRFFDALVALTDRDAPAFAPPGFYPALPNSPYYSWSGDWEFSPEFGADMSQKADDQPPDTFTFHFVGTDVGLRVRRANYRARFYVLIDGEPANALPADETTTTRGWGSALVLNTNDPGSDYLAVETVATNLEPGRHTMTVTAFRGWDQFALNGVAIRMTPVTPFDRFSPWLWGLMGLAIVGAIIFGRLGQWETSAVLQRLGRPLSRSLLAGLTILASLIVVISGWLTWNSPAAGAFRRLDDWPQLAIIFGTATVFYLTPWVVVYGLALLALFLLLRQRPAWGLVLVAFCFPFYVTQLTKPIATYRFSAVEIFMLMVFAAAVWHRVTFWARRTREAAQPITLKFSLLTADWAALAFTVVATASLLFTDRLDVATNEWRTVIFEPLLFYGSWRLINPSFEDGRRVVDGFLAGGTAVALIGLAQFFSGTNLITAEQGVFRLRSIYGSPNNVALYLGRQLPLLLGLILLSRPTVWRGKFADLWLTPRDRWQATALIFQLLAFGLTLSKGGLLIALPAAFLVVFALWLRVLRRPVWPWMAGAIVVGVISYAALLQLPALAPRLDFRSATAVLRINLWRASLPMWADHFWWGVGLDNFLYEYRSRYILAAAWQEPQLNHPHNLLLDLATRLGFLGLVSGLWLFWQPWRLLKSHWTRFALDPAKQPYRRGLTAGLLGSVTAMVAHGLVDHSFFLVDLAFGFYLILSLSVWLGQNGQIQPSFWQKNA